MVPFWIYEARTGNFWSVFYIWTLAAYNPSLEQTTPFSPLTYDIYNACFTPESSISTYDSSCGVRLALFFWMYWKQNERLGIE